MHTHWVSSAIDIAPCAQIKFVEIKLIQGETKTSDGVETRIWLIVGVEIVGVKILSWYHHYSLW